MANWTIEQVLDKVKNHTFTSANIGDTSSIDIGGTSYDIILIGLNHDDLADGSGKAYTTWQLKNCYNTSYKMNSTDTNTGGYGSSAMHKTHLPSIFNQIQSDIRNAIKPVIKKASAGSQSTTIIDTICNLFLLSEIEIFGETTYSVAGEGTQYAYWQQHNNDDDRRKGLQSNPTSYLDWGERSPNVSDSTAFLCVSSEGMPYSELASTSQNISFAFCI